MDNILKSKLDNCIDTEKEMPIDLDGNTAGKWIIYEHCKNIMQEFTIPLTIDEWSECIEYLTRRLDL